MNKFTKVELEEALQILASIINRCEKVQPKFVKGTAQHTLLKNRIKAMYISKSLIINENIEDKYSKIELIDALLPVSSIIHKCEKAQSKFVVGDTHYNRLNKMIKAMHISKAFIEDEVSKRS